MTIFGVLTHVQKSMVKRLVCGAIPNVVTVETIFSILAWCTLSNNEYFSHEPMFILYKLYK